MIQAPFLVAIAQEYLDIPHRLADGQASALDDRYQQTG
jgi:hypothetical protein